MSRKKASKKKNFPRKKLLRVAGFQEKAQRGGRGPLFGGGGRQPGGGATGGRVWTIEVIV
jgi:hypothetical protein